MAKDFAAQFRIEPGERAHLDKRDADDASAFPDRQAAEQQSAKDGASINEWQDKLYAEGKYALPRRAARCRYCRKGRYRPARVQPDGTARRHGHIIPRS